MTTNVTIFVAPGVAIVFFSVITCVCVRIYRRKNMDNAMQQSKNSFIQNAISSNSVPSYQPSIPFVVPTQSASTYHPSIAYMNPNQSSQTYFPMNPYAGLTQVPPMPSAPALSSDTIMYPYVANVPPEFMLPSPQYLYPATYPNTHIPLSQVTTENRIYWNT